MLANANILLTHSMLLVVLVVAANLLYGRFRSTALVKAGRVTAEEVSYFVRWAFVIVGGAFFGFWLVQVLAELPDPLCVIAFPPRQPAGFIGWLIQGMLSGTTVYWLWMRNGHNLLARLAPAFTTGSVLDRQFSPANVRIFVTAIVILSPLGNIAIQLYGPIPPVVCEIPQNAP